MITILATVAATLYLVIGSVVIGAAVVLTFWIPPRTAVATFWARFWSLGVLYSSGVRVRPTFETELGGGRYVFVANHQSLIDIPALLTTLPVPTRFLAKRSLFRVPFFGQALRAAGFVPVDRGDRTSALQALSQAANQLRGGCSILVFPEETRSPDGRLLPFKRGGFWLAMKEQVPVVPVGIRGTRKVRAKSSWVVRPGVVELHYGRPISLVGPRLERRVVEEVRAEVARLAGEQTIALKSPRDQTPGGS